MVRSDYQPPTIERVSLWPASNSIRDGMGSLVVLLLAERARSECARSTRAIEDRPGYPLKRKVSELGGMKRARPGALLARRAPTMKRWSLDARSQGQPWPFPLKRANGNGNGLVRRPQLKAPHTLAWLAMELEKKYETTCVMDASTGALMFSTSSA